MAFPTKDTFTFDFEAQTDYPNWTPAQTKEYMNARGEELRAALNAVVDLLNATTSDASGADNTGIPEIIAGSGTNIRDRADWLYAQIVAAVLGAIPDGSLATIKYADGSVTAAKVAADVATQAELDDLAGVGRTTETVKGNADSLAIHQAEDATQAHLAKNIGLEDTAGNFESEQVEGALAELAARPQKDVDNGRYQAEFGWGGAVYSDTLLSGGVVSISDSIASNVVVDNQYLGVYSSLNKAAKITAIKTSSTSVKVRVKISREGTLATNLTLNVYASSGGLPGTILGTASIAYATVSTPAAVKEVAVTLSQPLLAGTSYFVGLLCSGGDGGPDLYTWRALSPATPNAYQYSGGTWTANTTMSLYCEVVDAIAPLTGTVTKTTTPADLKKYGNSKWTQTTPAAGSSVVCDILDGAYSSTPAMTSNTLPSGVVSSSSDYSGSYLPYLAVNRVLSDYWRSNAKVCWWKYQPATAKVYDYCAIVANTGANNAPKAFTIDGSNDNSNWTTLRTVSDAAATLTTGTRAYNLNNNTAYAYYRVNVTDNYSGNAYTEIIEIILLEKIKPAVTSIADLSDIDPIVYPSIQQRWTLIRLAVSDASPTVSNPSITWEGQNSQAGTWVNILKENGLGNSLTLTSAVTRIDFADLDLDDYKYLKIIGSAGCSTANNIFLHLVFNDDVANSYEWQQIRADATTVSSQRNSNIDYIQLMQAPESSNAFFGTCEAIIANIATKYKDVSITENGFGSSLPITLSVHGWWKNSTALVTKISVIAATQGIAIGSTFILLGVK